MHFHGGLTSTISFSKVVHLPGVKTESKQVVFTSSRIKGYCLSETLGIHSEYIGSQALLPVRIVQSFYDDRLMLDQGIIICRVGESVHAVQEEVSKRDRTLYRQVPSPRVTSSVACKELCWWSWGVGMSTAGG